MLVSIFVIAALCTVFAHPESIVIMRGDYEFDQWMFIPASSKTWLLVFILGSIGGLASLLVYKIVKLRGKNVR